MNTIDNGRFRLLCTVVTLCVGCTDDLPSVPTGSSGDDTTTSGPSMTGMTPTTMDTTMTPADGSSTMSMEGSSTMSMEGSTTSMEGSTTQMEGSTTQSESSSSTTASESSSTTDASESSSSSSSTTEGMSDDDTFYEIQDGTIATGEMVDVQGVIVTGVSGQAFFAQEPAGGQYSGMYVYLAAAPMVSVGDEVDIMGTVEEFNDLTEINASMGMVTPTGVTGVMLMPEVVPAADLTAMTGEPWESVLVRIEGAPLTVVDIPGFSEFYVNDGGADDTRIDNFLYSVFDFPGVYTDFGIGASFTAIQGPLNYTFGEFKVAPREEMDLEGYIGGPPAPGESIDNLMPGDLVVTEVMFDPNCGSDDCEWIEIYNASGVDVDLFGLRIQDNLFSAMNQGQITTNVLLPADSYAVLARGDAMSWPYAMMPADFYGGSPGFNNGGGGDLVAILNAAEILDQTATYPTFGASDNGISWKLDPMSIDAMANDMPASWCFSTVVFDSPGGVDEYGSPGALNEAACAMLP